MLAEISVSDFDDWFHAIINRPWHQDPVRFYGNHQLCMLNNINSKHQLTPEEVDIYYRPAPKPTEDWRSIKAKMSGLSGVMRKE